MSCKIIFENKRKTQLRHHELDAILLLLEYFNSDITCICPSDGKTPDLRINDRNWELKSPIGNGPKTIENIIKKATRQSDKIILDLSRIKMNKNQAFARIKYYLKTNSHGIRAMLIITKAHKIIDFADYL